MMLTMLRVEIQITKRSTGSKDTSNYAAYLQAAVEMAYQKCGHTSLQLHASSATLV